MSEYERGYYDGLAAAADAASKESEFFSATADDHPSASAERLTLINKAQGAARVATKLADLADSLAAMVRSRGVELPADLVAAVGDG